MVAVNENWWVRHGSAKIFYIRGGANPQIIHTYTNDPYAGILDDRCPLSFAYATNKLLNCGTTINQISDQQRILSLRRTTKRDTSGCSDGGMNSGGGGNSNGSGRSFLVNFLNLIHAFLVNRCRNDKSYTVSHMLVRQSVCLYAASSFILMLCCLVTSTEANDSPSSMYE